MLHHVAPFRIAIATAREAAYGNSPLLAFRFGPLVVKLQVDPESFGTRKAFATLAPETRGAYVAGGCVSSQVEDPPAAGFALLLFPFAMFGIGGSWLWLAPLNDLLRLHYLGLFQLGCLGEFVYLQLLWLV